MPQDRKSGAQAREWGLATARKIAKNIGATMVREGSNEACYQGKRIVIKCCKENTNKVGVTNGVVQRVEFVLGAFRTKHNTLAFNLWKLPIEEYKKEMKVTAIGKPNMVAHALFENKGRLTEITLDE